MRWFERSKLALSLFSRQDMHLQWHPTLQSPKKTNQMKSVQFIDILHAHFTHTDTILVFIYTHKYRHPHPHAEQQPVGFGNEIVQSVHGGSIGTAACGEATATFVRTLSAFLSQLFLSHHLFLGGAMQLPSGNFSRNCRTMSGSLRHTPSSWLPRVILEKTSHKQHY